MNTVILTALVSTSVLFGGSLMLNNNDCNERMENHYQSDSNFWNDEKHMNAYDYEGMMFDNSNNKSYSSMHRNYDYESKGSSHMNNNDYEGMMFDNSDDDGYNKMHMSQDDETRGNSHMNGSNKMHNNK